MTPDQEQHVSNPVAAEKERYAVSCLLIGSDEKGYVFSGTLHIISANSENEAKGIAVEYANKNKPNLGVHGVFCIKINESQPQQIPEGWQARAALRPVIPEGWQLVPKEPTEEMKMAFHSANEWYENGCDGNRDITSPSYQWRSMLAAAPQPENAP